MKTLYIPLTSLLLIQSFAVQADVTRECRGVAAGIVSAMKSNDEIANEDMMLVAVKAARRACAAALEGFSEDDIAEAQSGSSKDEREMSTWEYITRKQEKKAGNKRLDRLKN